jgi:hypothetical protein
MVISGDDEFTYVSFTLGGGGSPMDLILTSRIRRVTIRIRIGILLSIT